MNRDHVLTLDQAIEFMSELIHIDDRAPQSHHLERCAQRTFEKETEFSLAEQAEIIEAGLTMSHLV